MWLTQELKDYIAPEHRTSAQRNDIERRTAAGLHQLVTAVPTRPAIVPETVASAGSVVPSEKPAGRHANKKAIQALDNALGRGANIALSQFIPSQPVQPLTVTQRRSFPKVPDPVTGELEPRA